MLDSFLLPFLSPMLLSLQFCTDSGHMKVLYQTPCQVLGVKWTCRERQINVVKHDFDAMQEIRLKVAAQRCPHFAVIACCCFCLLYKPQTDLSLDPEEATSG